MLLLVSVKGGVEESIDRTTGDRQKHDQIQANQVIFHSKNMDICNSHRMLKASVTPLLII